MKKIFAGVAQIVLLFYVHSVPAFAQETLDLNKGMFVAEPTTASNVIRFVFNLLIVVGLVMSLAFLLYGGVRWVMSGGDKAAVESARSTIIAAVTGLVLIILSWVIFNLILRLFGIGGLNSINLPTLNSPG